MSAPHSPLGLPEEPEKVELDRGLRWIALFEGTKGALVLVTGFGLLSLIHQNLHGAAVRLVEVMHLNPASHYPQIFIDLAGRLTDLQLWAIAAMAVCYALIRFIEAWGLWHQYAWAEWFGLLSGAIYIPLELYELLRQPTWPRSTLLALNLLIVVYLILVVRRPAPDDEP